MHTLLRQLFPLHRSMAGPGLRETIHALNEHIPLEITEVPTNTSVLDWQVPAEWHIRDAYIKDSKGNRIADYGQSNLYVLNHSTPIDCRMSWRELRPRIHTNPETPEWIPYRTAFFPGQVGVLLALSNRPAA